MTISVLCMISRVSILAGSHRAMLCEFICRLHVLSHTARGSDGESSDNVPSRNFLEAMFSLSWSRSRSYCLILGLGPALVLSLRLVFEDSTRNLPDNFLGARRLLDIFKQSYSHLGILVTSASLIGR